MHIEMTNGASVSRLHRGETVAELLSVFQYMTDAEEFAALLIERDRRHGFGPCSYIVANCYNGRLEIKSPPSPIEPMEAEEARS